MEDATTRVVGATGHGDESIAVIGAQQRVRRYNPSPIAFDCGDLSRAFLVVEATAVQRVDARRDGGFRVFNIPVGLGPIRDVAETLLCGRGG
jgi:hypothetical protein